MDEAFLWIIVVLLLIAFGVVLYLLIAIPMRFYLKKEIEAFAQLAEKHNFEKKLGKAGLKPNFPVIKGFHNKFFFIVKKVRSKTSSINYYSGGALRTRKWFVQISTKIKNPGITKLQIDNNKKIKEGASIADFQRFFKLEIEPADLMPNFLNDEMKIELFDLAKNTPYCRIELDKDILSTPMFMGLTKPEHVDDGSRKIDMLSKLAARIHSMS